MHASTFATSPGAVPLPLTYAVVHFAALQTLAFCVDRSVLSTSLTRYVREENPLTSIASISWAHPDETKLSYEVIIGAGT
jgi:hypothetical protein